MVARCCHSNATFGEASEVVQTWVLFTNSPRMPQKGKKTVVQSVVAARAVKRGTAVCADWESAARRARGERTDGMATATPEIRNRAR